MKPILTICIIVVIAWVYLNRDQFFSHEETDFCKEWHATLESAEYSVSYGDRVKALMRGCF